MHQQGLFSTQDDLCQATNLAGYELSSNKGTSYGYENSSQQEIFKDLGLSLSQQSSLCSSQNMEIVRRVREMDTNRALHVSTNYISPQQSEVVDLAPRESKIGRQAFTQGSTPETLDPLLIKICSCSRGCEEKERSLSFSQMQDGQLSAVVVSDENIEPLIKSSSRLYLVGDSHHKPIPIRAIANRQAIGQSVKTLHLRDNLSKPVLRRTSAPRIRKTPQQVAVLESVFRSKNFLHKEERMELSRSTGLSDSQIRLWFQTQRNKLAKSSKI